MRAGFLGPAVMLGLLSGVLQPAMAGDDGVTMRYVAQSGLLRTIDPRHFRHSRRTVSKAGRGTKAEAVRVPLPVAAPRKGGAAKTQAAEVSKARRAQKPSRFADPASWPVTLKEHRARAEEAKATAAGKVDRWSPNAVKSARARCAQILKRISGVAVYEEPIKRGACGTPAPIRLISVGRKPEVVISPPALINCEMAEALYTWLQDGLQPLARKHLGGPIIKIVKMSDYSCRNAYGRAKGRLSEHGRANALDIAGFETARGDNTMLLADWGRTQRDIRRQIAAAKAKARAEEKLRRDAQARAPSNEAGTKPTTALGITSGAPSGAGLRQTIADGVAQVTGSISAGAAGASSDDGRAAAFSMEPNRLGGPKPHRQAVSGLPVHRAGARRRRAASARIGKQKFLRGAHKSACGIFGTVLGPEANNAHRNHFHVDLATRRSGPFCQ